MPTFTVKPISYFIKLTGNELQREIVETYKSLVKQATSFQRAKTSKPKKTDLLKTFLGEPLLPTPENHFDREAGSGAVEMQKAAAAGDWQTVWRLSNELLDELELSGKAPCLSGLDQIASASARYQVAHRWLIFMSTLAEERLRPVDGFDYDFLDDGEDEDDLLD
jgi:hypothetical protein